MSATGVVLLAGAQNGRTDSCWHTEAAVLGAFAVSVVELPTDRMEAVPCDCRAHTGGCTFVQIFATPGCRITSACYSHQYHHRNSGGSVAHIAPYWQHTTVVSRQNDRLFLYLSIYAFFPMWPVWSGTKAQSRNQPELIHLTVCTTGPVGHSPLQNAGSRNVFDSRSDSPTLPPVGCR